MTTTPTQPATVPKALYVHPKHGPLYDFASMHAYAVAFCAAAPAEPPEVSSEGQQPSSEGSALQITRVDNAEGGAMSVVRWQVETPAGWVGAYHREALEALICPTMANDILQAQAEGRIAHNYAGLCPDQQTGHDARDSACKVCAALGSAHVVQAPAGHIPQPYIVAEIRARIASRDYNAEMLLQHAMMHLSADSDSPSA
ncbi:hypothetical protein [Acidovorax sp. FG27]|uniref:hypothetical protein n=1 Tax=Acidovorax sp. FG27 TaxID=3133652 RepID=UPI0030E9EA54